MDPFEAFASKRDTVEPTADIRSGAASCFEMYVGLRQAGFNQSEACGVLGAWLAGIGTNNGDTPGAT